jgi:hypothetical protein
MGLGCWEDCMSFWLVPNPIQIWITLNALVLYFVWFTYSRIDYNKLQLLLVILKFSPLFACCGKLWSMPKGFNSILAKIKDECWLPLMTLEMHHVISIFWEMFWHEKIFMLQSDGQRKQSLVVWTHWCTIWQYGGKIFKWLLDSCGSHPNWITCDE